MAVKLRLGVLASGGGSNLQAVIDATKAGRLTAIPCIVISNNSGAFALTRAQNAGIPTFHLSTKTHPDPDELDKVMLQTLLDHGVDIVVLAGYMKKLGHRTLRHYKGRIINVHPALLPKHGGYGMYGRYVHESVLASGDTITGVTIHLVEEEYDTGPILAQCEVPVHNDDTVETLAERVLQQEHRLYVETLQKICEGSIELP
jgi:phosphoribosylglycinamide formyltransferase 1